MVFISTFLLIYIYYQKYNNYIKLKKSHIYSQIPLRSTFTKLLNYLKQLSDLLLLLYHLLFIS